MAICTLSTKPQQFAGEAMGENYPLLSLLMLDFKMG